MPRVILWHGYGVRDVDKERISSWESLTSLLNKARSPATVGVRDETQIGHHSPLLFTYLSMIS